jgi:hypothetical protein
LVALNANAVANAQPARGATSRRPDAGASFMVTDTCEYALEAAAPRPFEAVNRNV